MKKYFRIFLIAFWLVIFNSCNDNDEVVTSDEKGQFSLDRLQYRIGKGIAPNDSLRNYLWYDLKYHFENEPGTLQTLAFYFPDSSVQGYYFDYGYPTPINEITGWVDSIWLNQILNLGDCMKIFCSMSGAFWQKLDSSYRFTGTFSIQNEQIVNY